MMRLSTSKTRASPDLGGAKTEQKMVTQTGEHFAFTHAVLSNAPQLTPSNPSNVLVSNQNTTTSRQGFSKAKLDAQKAGGVTPANSPSTKNSLGLRIE